MTEDTLTIEIRATDAPLAFTALLSESMVEEYEGNHKAAADQERVAREILRSLDAGMRDTHPKYADKLESKAKELGEAKIGRRRNAERLAKIIPSPDELTE